MTYFFFYHLFRLVAKLRFKTINLSSEEHLYSQQPLIIVANHGNSFLDAILLAVIFKRKLHFLARADVFNTKFKRWFLGKLNMMPIYRIRDGREVLKNNDLIFNKCAQILKINGAILVFPEGNCVVEKRLRDFKTGFVNLAYETEVENLAVLPISLNYANLKSLNTHIHVVFNSTINITDLKKETTDFVSFSKLLLSKTENAITQNMVQIKDQDQEGFYNQIFTVARNHVALNEMVVQQIQACNYLRNLKINNQAQFEELIQLSSTYFQDLMLLNVDDLAVEKEFSLSEKLLYYLLLPVYYIGKLINYLPSLLLNKIVNESVKELQFKNSVKLVLTPIIYFVFIFLLSVIPKVWNSNSFLIFLSFTILLLAYAYLKNIMDVFSQLIFLKPKYLTDLKAKRAELVKFLNL
jgi:1-acyl-sn-glycerol-3-phosphate acyltransferase